MYYQIVRKNHKMFINRENSPATCCCGCQLEVGIFLAAVLQGLRLVGAIVSLEPKLIAIEVVIYLPLIALAINRSWIVRQINYVWQNICLIALIISLLAIVLAEVFLNISAEVCKMETELLNKMQDNCEHNLKTFIYATVLIANVVFVPLQYLIVSIFKAYRDELADDVSLKH